MTTKEKTITKRAYNKKVTKPSDTELILGTLRLMQGTIIKALENKPVAKKPEINETDSCAPAMHNYTFVGDQGFYKKDIKGEIDTNIVYRIILCENCGSTMEVVVVDRTPKI